MSIIKVIFFYSTSAYFSILQKKQILNLCKKYDFDFKMVDIYAKRHQKTISKLKIVQIPTTIIYAPTFSLRYDGYTSLKQIRKELQEYKNIIKMY